MDRDDAAWRIWGDGAIEGPARAKFLVSGGPGDDDDDEDETPIGDPDEDDWEGEDWDEDDDEPLQAAPRPPRGPGDVEEDELPVGDPPDDDPTDDPDDEDEGEGDEEPMQGRRAPRARPSRAGRSALADRRTPRVDGQVQPRIR